MTVARCRLLGTFAETWKTLEESHGDRDWLVVVDRRLVRARPGLYRGLRAARRRGVVELTGGETVKSLRRIDDLAAAAHRVGHMSCTRSGPSVTSR